VKGSSTTEADPTKVVSVLVISPIEEDHASLQRIFARTRWNLYQASSITHALSFLREHPTPVVLCETDLRLGTWKELLEHTELLPDPPLLIVTAHHADDALWAEALNLGVFDVLAKPFDRQEVVRAISSAWLRWKRQHKSVNGVRREDPLIDVGLIQAGAWTS
jgi:DNA-binding NtrC family response regulator